MANPIMKKRIQSIDALRGFVMIVMALDHVRELFHTGAMSFQPDDLTRTTTMLFLTRWITHICAPVFAFTAGLSAYLRQGGSRYLVPRGLWLIALDLVVLRLAMFFSLTSGPVILNVLWMLGWSMVLLAALIRLPIRVIAALSIAIIVLHNLADGVRGGGWLWNVLHQPGVVVLKGVVVLVAYPLIPWIAVMALGYCFGPLMRMDGAERSRILFGLGTVLTLAFIVVRWVNVYGDPQPWTGSALSFLRTTKYPPSLQFLLMTLGPAMLIWSWFEGMTFSRRNPLIVLGRVPLFYFIGHFFVAHALAFPFVLARYGTARFLWQPMPSMGGPADSYPPNFGYSLPVVYVVWVLVVALMYPLCVITGRVKSRAPIPSVPLRESSAAP